MNRILITALALATLAAPALASDSLARSVGVEPGAFTTAQLVALKAAQDGDDHTRIDQILAEAEAGGFGPATGLGQIAATLDAQGASVGRLVALKAAHDDDDSPRIHALRSVDTAVSGTTVSSRGTGASVQLSRSAGVAPGALSKADLVVLKAAQDDDDHSRIRSILAGVN